MNEKIIEQMVKEFAASGEYRFEKTYRIKGADGVYYKVEIEKHSAGNKEIPLFESVGTESFNTISALPSGAQCGCCNGSGRSL